MMSTPSPKANSLTELELIDEMMDEIADDELYDDVAVDLREFSLDDEFAIIDQLH